MRAAAPFPPFDPLVKVRLLDHDGTELDTAGPFPASIARRYIDDTTRMFLANSGLELRDEPLEPTAPPDVWQN